MKALAVLAIATWISAADVSSPPVPGNGIKLAENGHCREALPLLKKALPLTTNRDSRRTIGVHLVRCAAEMQAFDDGVTTMRLLSREYPGDPEVLFLAVHFYSDLSLHASRELLYRAPASPQVHELNAESLETQGKWEEAAREYRAALEKNQALPGIHFKLGRLILSAPKTATTVDDARREFELELKINPENAGAEYVLGELARQAEQWPDAIAHFSRAAKLDANFADAQIGLGRALLAADRASEAIAPLEKAVKLQPDNPAAHFQLATAYRRTGRKADADRESLAHQHATEKIHQASDQVRKAVSGVP
jgi:tetratricopeptide (TPR) repeat protein